MNKINLTNRGYIPFSLCLLDMSRVKPTPSLFNVMHQTQTDLSCLQTKPCVMSSKPNNRSSLPQPKGSFTRELQHRETPTFHLLSADHLNIPSPSSMDFPSSAALLKRPILPNNRMPNTLTRICPGASKSGHQDFPQHL